MRGQQKFFICRHCGNVVGMIHNAGVSLVCCGEAMQELIPNTQEAATEKHLPAVKGAGGRFEVNIGEVDHPMLEEHHIEWVYLETRQGGQRKCLSPGDKPHVVFVVEDDEPLAVYAYCNLHGLWKTAVS